ncbi:Nuclear receptor subfamily 0 group B member 2 [Acipenser ruthenus]|uniref:Nuclear receptor subfamily 0 group B member 2 n=2 Tax=Acipenseridae TaxID=7900 RepID=A0A444V6F0_ACIRT|nr:Nuclear receptor subfamily 0 group B member 2 [Acipenser ruthenus]
MLFNPDVPGLRSSVFIDSLQQEAQRALREILVPLHPEDRGRFARILLTASTLNTTPPALITELFFRPVIGQADLLELLAEMLLAK